MPPNLPGFCWDPDKNRYFKTTTSATTPSAAPYTANSIKRRQTEAHAQKKVRRRKHQIRDHRKRSAVDDFWTFTGPLGGAVEGGRTVREGDVRCMAWARGLMGKGGVRFGDDRGDGVNLGAFSVGEGWVCASTDDESVQYAKTKTDSNGHLRACQEMEIDDETSSILPTGVTVCRDVSSINCDADGRQLLATSRGGEDLPSVYILRTGERGGFHSIHRMSLVEQRLGRYTPRGRNVYSVNTCAVTPLEHRFSSTALGLLGHNKGVVEIATPHLAYDDPIPSFCYLTDYRDAEITTATYSIAFQPDLGASLVFGGGRGPKIWSMDSRGVWPAESSPWDSVGNINHGSPVATVRFVNRHHVLAAGPRSKMALYDIRFTKNTRIPDYISKPMLTFPTYANTTRFDLGLDISPDGQSVVAAQEDGKVKVFSMGSGCEVACPALGAIGGGEGVREVKFGGEGDLYVGVGGSVRKFGFGTNSIDAI